MIIPEGIQHIDEQFFILINRKWANGFFDLIMPPVRDRLFWIFLYILIAGIIFWKFRLRGLWIILLLAATFGITDQLSSSVIKPAVGRIRPCNDEQFKDEVILRISACGVGKSFTSSHAANTFAFAVLLSLLFRARWKYITPLAIFWAALVSYAQIYVGVHYPFDIIGGALVGSMVSIIMYLLAKKFIFPKFMPELLQHKKAIIK
ncbi:MAG: phosphatase PAP2 family protein [Chitinophagales bacterium]